MAAVAFRGARRGPLSPKPPHPAPKSSAPAAWAPFSCPLVRSLRGDTIYTKVTPEDAPAVLAGTCRGIPNDHPFYKGQQRLILSNSGHTDPERIHDYIAVGGRSLLRAVTEMTPEQIVAEIRSSGLRGRGGAGYPAGLKWELVARQKGPVKYIVCNADEGDPGACMNRSVLEGDPHKVLEGMAIAGLAVGARQGYIYARGESPLAIERLRTAIEQARREGLLGDHIRKYRELHRQDRRGRLCLWRRDGADCIHRRQTRPADSPAALSARARPVECADAHQQR